MCHSDCIVVLIIVGGMCALASDDIFRAVMGNSLGIMLSLCHSVIAALQHHLQIVTIMRFDVRW